MSVSLKIVLKENGDFCEKILNYMLLNWIVGFSEISDVV